MKSDFCGTSGWTLEEEGFDSSRTALNGSKFLLGNGYMGYRGTLEEFRAEHLVGNIIAGLYDKVGDGWREPVNAPNALYVGIRCDGVPISVLETPIEEHRQSLDIRRACHRRETVFALPDGNRVTFVAERFLSLDNRHLMAVEVVLKSERAASLEIDTGIDPCVWDINGPHLENVAAFRKGSGALLLQALTHELGTLVCIAEQWKSDSADITEVTTGDAPLRRLTISAQPGRSYRFWKSVAVYTENDGVDSVADAALVACESASCAGYSAMRNAHDIAWERCWHQADVEIKGDDAAQFALRYSLYHLLAIAPPPGRSLSIPARGLSGQVYKGAVFWDTEMFMVPFFLSSHPEIARNLLLYRFRTLDGARRKAREYGYEGAFFAWESQETGDDACTHFNVSDIFTGRPMRTHFRDKQIHISAAVAHAFWKYYLQTGDLNILLEGGAEVIFECARFYYSYSHYKPSKKRLEFLDVVGPDEYHERVHNNAYTNRMVLETLLIAQRITAVLERERRSFLDDLVNRLGFAELRKQLPELAASVYIPVPDAATDVIPQFDGYEKLEEISISDLKKRLLKPNEYLGGGNGLATTTQILKQADVVLMLSLFGDDYTLQTKRKNWEYYEPRTEHGSSLSACAYGLLACEIGELKTACRFFMQTASIDLTGHAKQYLGTLYIGGTHPAANGGAWMVAVNGFAGFKVAADSLLLNPKLPAHWQELRFRVHWHGLKFEVSVRHAEVEIRADTENSAAADWIVQDCRVSCQPGATVLQSVNNH